MNHHNIKLKSANVIRYHLHLFRTAGMWFECFVCTLEGNIGEDALSHNAISKIIENDVNHLQKFFVVLDDVIKFLNIDEQVFRGSEGVFDVITPPPDVSGERSIKVPMTIITTVFHTTKQNIVAQPAHDAEGGKGTPIRRSHRFMKKSMASQSVLRLFEDSPRTWHGGRSIAWWMRTRVAIIIPFAGRRLFHSGSDSTIVDDVADCYVM